MEQFFQLTLGMAPGELLKVCTVAMLCVSRLASWLVEGQELGDELMGLTDIIVEWFNLVPN